MPPDASTKRHGAQKQYTPPNRKQKSTGMNQLKGSCPPLAILKATLATTFILKHDPARLAGFGNGKCESKDSSWFLVLGHHHQKMPATARNGIEPSSAAAAAAAIATITAAAVP